MNTCNIFSLIVGLCVFSTVVANEPRLDHVIVAVNDIHSAKRVFQQSGFTVKGGKVHDNGLVNAFIEFMDGTEIELMSVLKESTDPLASTYSKFLSVSEGGIFVALGGFSVTKASSTFKAAGIDHNIKVGNRWKHLSFPINSGLEHVFLIEYHNPDVAIRTLVNHENGVTGIEEIWLVWNEKLVSMLHMLGVPKASSNDLLKLSNAVLRFKARENYTATPRFNGIVLSADDNTTFTEFDAHEIGYLSADNSADD